MFVGTDGITAQPDVFSRDVGRSTLRLTGAEEHPAPIQLHSLEDNLKSEFLVSVLFPCN